MEQRILDLIASAKNFRALWLAYMDDDRYTRPDDYPTLREAIDKVVEDAGKV